jgi:hypothetical protein
MTEGVRRCRARYDKRYDGLIIHDLRRSPIRNLVAAGATERVAMSLSGHKTRSLFDRYDIVDASDVQRAPARVENLVPLSPLRSPLLGGRTYGVWRQPSTQPGHGRNLIGSIPASSSYSSRSF